MKKSLLIGLALGVGSAAVAQGTSTGPSSITPQKVRAMGATKKASVVENQTVGGTTDAFESMVYSLGTHPQFVPTTKAVTSAVIGTTEYQNQTNSSVCNRIVKSPDGTISATWTFAADPAWADRGTGYNYFDGTSWGAAPTVRIESVRTGFTNIGVTGSMGEVVVAHTTATTDLAFLSRPTKGTGSWTQTTLGVPDVWARLAVGGTGNSYHVISQTSGTGTTPFMGQDGAISYTRSQDGGVTWDKVRSIIPQIDSASYLGFGGDSYSIDANGNTIAIVAGGFDVDVVLIKSTDNGNTWTKTIVNDFGIPLYNSATMITDNNGDSVADTIESNDASVNVVLDASNNAHVFFGRMRVICDAPGTGTGLGLSYFPYTDGLMYWNETMGAAAPVMIAATRDYNSNGLLDVYVPGGTTLGMGTFQTSLTSFPNAGIDASGNLYVTYSSLFEGINDAGDGYDIANATLGPLTSGKSFRHQYLIKSTDNGVTWCNPIDLTQPDYTNGSYDYHEGVYGAMAKDVDGNVHIIVQDDQAAGHGVSTTTTPDPQAGPANIIYYKVPVAEACAVSVGENNDLITEMTLYPNPASGSVTFSFESKKASKATVTVYNMVGQAVYSLDKNLTTGNNQMKVDVSNYTAGIYFVSTIVEGKTYSQKLIVK